MMHNPKPENAVKKPYFQKEESQSKKIIEQALNRLLDEHDEDPRSPLIRDLQKLLDEPDTLPDTEIELTAVLKPNGSYLVHDQHGRKLSGVKSVAVFQDQGQMVFQVNL